MTSKPQRSDILYEVNSEMDRISTLFYKVLDYPEDVYSEDKELVKRELRFALQDLLNRADTL